MRIETHNPVPDNLPANAANPRRLGTAGAIVNRRQRQQTPGLIRILRCLRKGMQVSGRKIIAQRNRCTHGEPP